VFSGLITVDFERRLPKDDIGIWIHATCFSTENKPASEARRK